MAEISMYLHKFVVKSSWYTVSLKAPHGSTWDVPSYLLKASLNQVLREEVSDKVKKGIKTGNLVILSSFS